MPDPDVRSADRDVRSADRDVRSADRGPRRQRILLVDDDPAALPAP